MVKNAELELSVEDLYAENAKLEKAFGEEIRKNAALDHEIRRLEAANATLKSKATAEESDWDILGLVEDSPIEDVKKQSKLMLLINHPDKSGQLQLPANRELSKYAIRFGTSNPFIV